MIPREVLGAFDEFGPLLGAVLDQTHDCIKLLDPDGTIRYVNERGAIAMELRAPAELIGQRWVERWPDEMRAVVEQALEEARSGAVARFTGSRTIGGKPSWWDVTVTPVRLAQATEYLLVIARDMTAEVEERRRAEAVSAEMRHRLRNAMAIASALVHMGARGKPELQAFADEVAFRFAQLGRVQELVLDSAPNKSLKQVVTLLGNVYDNLEIGPMPEIELEDATMQALALAFGELATNSLKYGALKDGTAVRVAGQLADGELQLTWQEETALAPRRAGGQGLDLIDRIMRASGGRIERRVEDHRFTVQAIFPVQPPHEAT
ncbi:PAS domain-containing protein [Pelagerythrobacter aerophilus]